MTNPWMPNLTPIDDKILYNVGPLLDIPTGKYYIGAKGESLLNGGMPNCVGVAGIGNVGKSLLAKYYQYTTFHRFSHYQQAGTLTYDTEVNVSMDREMTLSSNIDGLEGEHNPFFDPQAPRALVTDKSIYTGDAFFKELKHTADARKKLGKSLLVDTPFLDPRTGKPRQVMIPLATLMDSLTEFETSDVLDMKDKNDLGEKGANTLYMRAGLSKSRMMGELITLIPEGELRMCITAHVGKHIPMDPNAPPVKTLQFLKNGDVIKGVTSKFFFLTNLCWQVNGATPLIHKDTKAPEYPMSSEDDMVGDTDLMRMTMTILRNKHGRTGLIVNLIFSQETGILMPLSEFDYIKTNDRFGFEGNLQNYSLVLTPDIKLSRTTVRRKCESEPKLRRALQILANMCMEQLLWTDAEGIQCAPKELYDDLIAIGYDWDTLLNTRYHFLPDQYDEKHLPFLSTRDLLRMRVGQYKPYWWPDSKPLDTSKCKQPKTDHLYLR